VLGSAGRYFFLYNRPDAPFSFHIYFKDWEAAPLFAERASAKRKAFEGEHMQFAKPAGVVATLALALSLALPVAGCAQKVDNPTQEQEQTSLAEKVDSIEVSGFDATGLELVSVAQDSQDRSTDNGQDKLVTKGVFEAANAVIEVTGSYVADWTLSEDVWELDGCVFTPEKVIALEAPSVETAQAIVDANFDAVASGFGISQDLLEGHGFRKMYDKGYDVGPAYSVEGFTVTDLSFDKDAQTATATVEVKGQTTLATNGTGTVELAVTDNGWSYVSASSDSTFEETYVGTWIGTPTSIKESYVDCSDGLPDELEDETYTSDASGATATVVITSQSEPDENGYIYLSGSISYSYDAYITSSPAMNEYKTEFVPFGETVDFTDQFLVPGDGSNYMVVDRSANRWNMKYSVTWDYVYEECDDLYAPTLTLLNSYPQYLYDILVKYDLSRA
jgi:hypothetical protein